MKKTALALLVLIFAAASAGARGRFSGGRGGPGGPGGRGFTGRGFSRPLSRPTFARSSSRASSSPAAFRPAARSGGFVTGGATRGHAAFGVMKTATRRAVAGTPPAGGSTGGTGSTTSAPDAPPAWATPGAKILTAGQQPVYSNAAGGGTHSVDGGGFIAIDQGRANDVARGPGISWGAADRTMSSGSGAGGNAVTPNGPVNPGF